MAHEQLNNFASVCDCGESRLYMCRTCVSWVCTSCDLQKHSFSPPEKCKLLFITEVVSELELSAETNLEIGKLCRIKVNKCVELLDEILKKDLERLEDINKEYLIQRKNISKTQERKTYVTRALKEIDILIRDNSSEIEFLKSLYMFCDFKVSILTYRGLKSKVV